MFTTECVCPQALHLRHNLPGGNPSSQYMSSAVSMLSLNLSSKKFRLKRHLLDEQVPILQCQCSQISEITYHIDTHKCPESKLWTRSNTSSTKLHSKQQLQLHNCTRCKPWPVMPKCRRSDYSTNISTSTLLWGPLSSSDSRCSMFRTLFTTFPISFSLLVIFMQN